MKPHIIPTANGPLIVNALPGIGSVSLQFDGRSVMLSDAESKALFTALACARSIARIDARQRQDAKRLDPEGTKAG